MDGLVTLTRRALPWRRAFRTADYTTAGTPTQPVDRLVAPNQVPSPLTGVIGFTGSPSVFIKPYGDADGATFTMWVIGWSKIQEDGLSGGVKQYTPVLLCKFAGTLGSTPGVANGVVPATGFYADTLADPTVGTKGVDCWVRTNGANFGAFYEVDTAGCELIQLIPELGTATAMNALVRGS